MVEVQASSENDEIHSAELRSIRDEVVKIITRVGNRFDELLLDKAAKYLIFKTTQEHKVGENALDYFPNAETAGEFFKWLIGSSHETQCWPDIEIGRYCTILFHVYDSCAPNTRLYARIAGKAGMITAKHFPKLCNLIEIEKEKLQLDDVLKDCEKPPRNRGDCIDHIRQYLNCINAYLDAEGINADLANSESAETDSQQKKIGFLSEITPDDRRNEQRKR